MKQENTSEKDFRIKQALIIAHERVIGKDIDNVVLDKILNDIILLYPKKSINTILEKISKGSRGFYGRSMRFTFQEVSYWIIKDDLKERL